MRVFIRNSQTGTYFRTPDHWVENSKEAFDFKECEGVVYAVTEFCLEEVEMVMMDDAGKHMFTIDLKPREGPVRVITPLRRKKFSFGIPWDF
jgi:hypothetical protein